MQNLKLIHTDCELIFEGDIDELLDYVAARENVQLRELTVIHKNNNPIKIVSNEINRGQRKFEYGVYHE